MIAIDSHRIVVFQLVAGGGIQEHTFEIYFIKEPVEQSFSSLSLEE